MLVTLLGIFSLKPGEYTGMATENLQTDQSSGSTRMHDARLTHIQRAAGFEMDFLLSTKLPLSACVQASGHNRENTAPDLRATRLNL